MPNGNFSPKKLGGFTYLGVLAILSVMMIAMGAAVGIWHTQMQRENEQELLFVGNQYRVAIGKYYQESGKGFPTSLAALLGEEGDAKFNKRYIRKLYRDPMTGNAEWGLVLGLNAEIVGVHSTSELKPYKIAGFREKDSAFEGKQKYSDWQFVYEPKKTAQSNAASGDKVNDIPRPVPRTGATNAELNTNGSSNVPLSVDRFRNK